MNVRKEEILLSLNVEGGAVWDFAWIFPYIADYEMNANIDIGTYTGVSVIAKVYTNNGEEKEEEEEEEERAAIEREKAIAFFSAMIPKNGGEERDG